MDISLLLSLCPQETWYFFPYGFVDRWYDILLEDCLSCQIPTKNKESFIFLLLQGLLQVAPVIFTVISKINPPGKKMTCSRIEHLLDEDCVSLWLTFCYAMLVNVWVCQRGFRFIKHRLCLLVLWLMVAMAGALTATQLIKSIWVHMTVRPSLPPSVCSPVLHRHRLKHRSGDPSLFSLKSVADVLP